MRWEFLNPAYWERKFVGGQLEKIGVRFVSIGDGFKQNLETILTNSLLGLGIEPLKPENLSPWEHQLSSLPREEYQILTIIDFDGVLINPPKEKKIPQERYRVFYRIRNASDQIVLLTSRINPESLREKTIFLRRIIDRFERGGIDNFPFFNQSAITKLKRWGKDRLVVERGKSLIISRRVEQMLLVAILNYLGI